MPTPSSLVTPEWLVNHLDDPNLVIVDCRFSLADPNQGRQQYEAGHIPNARYLDLNRDLSSPVLAHGGRHPLPDPDAFRQTLEAIGVSSQGSVGLTLVVAYDDSRFAFAARLWWLLKYLGHEAVAVLDGGWGGWQGGGYPVSTKIPSIKPGRFSPNPHSAWVVDIDYVRRRKDEAGVLLIDSRAPERYRGEVEPIDPVAGSIPGAANFFWQEVSTTAGQMCAAPDLAQHWASLDAADEVIVYCGSGVTACVNLLAQAVAGQPMGRLYAGGWSDWCSYL
ncbi:MAG: sulfurtransferase [Nodosilinea sp.]